MLEECVSGVMQDGFDSEGLGGCRVLGLLRSLDGDREFGAGGGPDEFTRATDGGLSGHAQRQ